MQILARQKRSAFIGTVSVGMLVAIAGIAGAFFLRSPAWFTALLSAWFLTAGLILVTVGISAWPPDGVAIALDEDGIRWHAPALRKPQRFIPWRDVAGVLVVRCSEEKDDPSEGVVLCLHRHAPNPMGIQWSQRLCEELRRRLGESIPENAVFFQDDRWSWNPVDVAREIRQRILCR